MMFRRRAQDAPDTEALRCSFCRKPQDSVYRLISNPSDYPRAYICDECITVCASILDDDRHPPDVTGSKPEPPESHPLQDDPVTPQLLAAVEDWIRKESSGADACEELAEVRSIAIRLMLPRAWHLPK
jgi:hypothetical protein